MGVRVRGLVLPASHSGRLTHSLDTAHLTAYPGAEYFLQTD